MQINKNIFKLFDRQDFTYRQGNEAVKQEYLEQRANWSEWCSEFAKKEKKFDVPVVRNWQNSGNLAKYLWTRLKYTPFLNSAANIALYIDKDVFNLELSYEFKNGDSNLSIEEYNNNLLNNIEEWVNRHSIDLNLFIIHDDAEKCTLKEYFNSSETKNYFKGLKNVNISVGVSFSKEQEAQLDTESELLIDVLKKLCDLYERVQKPNHVYNSLLKAKELIPDEYDGSYELVREIVSSYEQISNNALTLDDLDAMFFMCIGTFKHKAETKRQLIKKSHLPEAEKNRIIALIDKIENKSKTLEYTHTNEGAGSFGMFGEAVGTFRALYKENDDLTGARAFIKMCIDISKMDNEEEMFDLCDKVLKAGVKGMQTGKVSKFLHCLKPYSFPILNERQGKGTSVYDSLGIKLNKAEKAANYIENVRIIKDYRDKYFTFKNYRVMDIVEEENLEERHRLGGAPHEGSGDDDGGKVKEEPTFEPYTKEQLLEDAFITEEKYNTIVSRLENKKNIILQGAPGVGKSYLAKKIAFSIMGKIDESKVQMIQFHQSYSYEDFIMGYRPNKEGGFDVIDGVFYKFCKKAISNPEDKFYFIIDEINRGNLSKIFGELMLLIEVDKRGASYAMSTVYSEEKFYIPNNLYIIGLMNTADRSLALIDYALRRRFSFIDIEPAFGENFAKYTEKFKHTKLDKVLSLIQSINEDIEADESLGKGFKIGHSYFCNLKTASDYELMEIIDCEIIPLLEEYWIESADKVKNYSNTLHEALSND